MKTISRIAEYQDKFARTRSDADYTDFERTPAIEPWWQGIACALGMVFLAYVGWILAPEAVKLLVERGLVVL